LSALITGLLGISTISGIFPIFGFGRSFANSFWETQWADFSGLFELADDLDKTKFIWDEETRLACFR